MSQRSLQYLSPQCPLCSLCPLWTPYPPFILCATCLQCPPHHAFAKWTKVILWQATKERGNTTFISFGVVCVKVNYFFLPLVFCVIWKGNFLNVCHRHTMSIIQTFSTMFKMSTISIGHSLPYPHFPPCSLFSTLYLLISFRREVFQNKWKF